MRSDTRGILYPFNEYPDNPGRTRMVHKDELMKMKEGQLQLEGKKIVKLEAVNAVLLQDILSSITPTTIILKIDIEGYECKVGALVFQFYSDYFSRRCKRPFFSEKLASSFQSSFWSGTRWQGEGLLFHCMHEDLDIVCGLFFSPYLYTVIFSLGIQSTVLNIKTGRMRSFWVAIYPLKVAIP